MWFLQSWHSTSSTDPANTKIKPKLLQTRLRYILRALSFISSKLKAYVIWLHRLDQFYLKRYNKTAEYPQMPPYIMFWTMVTFMWWYSILKGHYWWSFVTSDVKNVVTLDDMFHKRKIYVICKTVKRKVVSYIDWFQSFLFLCHFIFTHQILCSGVVIILLDLLNTYRFIKNLGNHHIGFVYFITISKKIIYFGIYQINLIWMKNDKINDMCIRNHHLPRPQNIWQE